MQYLQYLLTTSHNQTYDLNDRLNMLGTKERILDAAERLFADHGFTNTSLRTIIGEARVNLAAVHYHFHSKDALLEVVILRRLEPVNRERLAMLDACERAAKGGSPAVEEILRAFIEPTVHLVRDPHRAGSVFGRLMGRLHAEGGASFARIARKYFGEIGRRFKEALEKALPELPAAEILWRMHFAIGAMAQALRCPPELDALSGGLCQAANLEDAIPRLVVFLTAGFRAPVSVTHPQEKVS
jgi:AcrR family transcriptional regulator